MKTKSEKERKEILSKAIEEIQKIAEKYNITIEGAQNLLSFSYVAHHEPGKEILFEKLNIVPF